MRVPLPMLLPAAALAGVPGPGAKPVEVPVGTVSTWRPGGPALAFTAGGTTVRVEALPCPARAPMNEGCRFEGVNNQASVTVSAPGVAPVRLASDDQASFVRVSAMRLTLRDRRPGVLVVSDYGGTGGFATAVVLAPAAGRFRAVPLRWRVPPGGRMTGALKSFGDPSFRAADGSLRLVFRDSSFGGAFGCNACSPPVPVVLAVRGGRSVDVSRERASRPAFARDMAVQRAACMSATPPNGACAAFVADAARIGRFAEAWAVMLRHHDREDTLSRWRGPDGRTRYRDFPASLRAFLRHFGYWPGRS